MLYEQCKNAIEERAQIDDWEKKKKNDEQYILNKLKVLYLLHIHPTSVTTFSQNIYFQLWLVIVSYFIILFCLIRN